MELHELCHSILMEASTLTEQLLPVASQKALEAQMRQFRVSEGLQPEVPQHSVREYLDTFDFRMLRAGERLCGHPLTDGYRLRWERSQGVALEANLPVRPTSVESLPRAWSEQLSHRLEPRVLIPLVRVEGRGRSYRALDATKKTVARIHAETVTFSTSFPESKETIVPLWRIEPLRGYGEAHRDWTRRVQVTVGDHVDPKDEWTLALELLQVPYKHYPKKPVPLDPGMPFVNAMDAIFRDTFHRMQRQEAGVRIDLDIEFLHEYRVAIRKTRSWLREFKNRLPNDRHWKKVKKDFRWLGRITSPVRDLDVWRFKLEKLSRADCSLGRDLQPLREYLAMIQRTAQVRMVREFDHKDHRGWADHWMQTLDRWRQNAKPQDTEPIDPIIRKKIYKLYKAMVSNREAILDPQADPEYLHRTRLKAKRLRYVLDGFQQALPHPEVKEALKRVRKLQNVLGDYNDLDVQSRSIGQYATEMAAESMATTASLLAAGALAERFNRQKKETKVAAQNKFKGFTSKETQQLFKTLRGPK